MFIGDLNTTQTYYKFCLTFVIVFSAIMLKLDLV